MQYRLRTLFIVTAMAPVLIGLPALTVRYAGCLRTPSIEIEFHFAREPTDFNVECIVDTKNGVMPVQIGPHTYRIDVPDSQVVRLQSGKIFHRWHQRFVVTPEHPQRRVMLGGSGYSQAGDGPGEEGARHVLSMKP
jgi:hypothetical protein